jgi:hypothetical protein
VNVDSSLQKFNRTCDLWLAELKAYDEEGFRRAPSSGGWTIGQVYAHIVDAGELFGIEKIETCFARPASASRLNWKGRLVFMLGGFPAIRATVPGDGSYAPQQPESMTAARERLSALKVKMSAIVSQVVDAKGTSRHPVFGTLDARQWFTLVEMHMRHHLRQKKRIDSMLSAS